MRAIAKYPVWYVVFSVLLLYATTADFIATSVVIADGQDCNHPALRIEHKCVTSSGRTGHADHSAVSIANVAHLTASISDPRENDQPVATLESSESRHSATPQDATPLRC